MIRTMTQPYETEEELISRAQAALSRCNWVIGECAARWTERYSRGRTDADFGASIGLSGDQVYQRRRVWETFSDVHEEYAGLKWSHFYAAVNWDDASECLQWANEMQSTVAEMKAWRRAQHGEDLTESPDEEAPFASGMELLSMETGLVRDPDGFAPGDRRGRRELEAESAGSERSTVGTLAREAEGASDGYAPFGKGARGSAPESSKSTAAPSAEQVIQRLASALEKCDAALTPDVMEEFRSVSYQLQVRFVNALDSLQAKSAGLR